LRCWNFDCLCGRVVDMLNFFSSSQWIAI